MALLDAQAAGLAKRFPLFCAERAAALFHADQTGTHTYRDHGYPAALMRNGVQWFYERKNRPKKVKAHAPTGTRPGLTDDPDLSESWHVIVEGEGDAVALASVGHRGIFCTGGTDYAREHARLFKGKRIWLLFDGDDAGARGARSFALAAKDAGAEAIHIARLPEGKDPEQWLAGFDTRERALGALQELLGKAESVDRDSLATAQREADEADGFTTETVFSAMDGESLLVTIWEPGWDNPQLAIFGPRDFGEDPLGAPSYPGGEREQGEQGEGAAVARGWRILEGLRVPDRKLIYWPGGMDGLGDLIREGSLIVPPTPARAVEDGAVWDQVTAYFQRWLEAAEDDYHLMTAYTLACWRLDDAHFHKAPFLRVWGASSSGKTRAIELLHLVSNVGLYATLTPANLHRVVENMGSFTLLWDEFNLENMSRDDARSLVNAMNLSQVRSSRMLRVVPGGKGEDMQVRAFKVFGPKVFCGYLPTEDDGFRRRTIEINMARVTFVPREKRFSQLPREALDEARECRAALLAWRAQALERGLVDSAADEAHSLLLDHEVHAMIDAYWPLLHVVPAGADEVRDVLIARAVQAEEEFRRNRHTKSEAYILEQLVEQLRSGRFYLAGANKHPAVLLEDMTEQLDQFIRADFRTLSTMLRELDLEITRPRLYQRGRDGAYLGRRSAVVVRPTLHDKLKRVARTHGVHFDPADIPDNDNGEGGL